MEHTKLAGAHDLYIARAANRQLALACSGGQRAGSSLAQMTSTQCWLPTGSLLLLAAGVARGKHAVIDYLYTDTAITESSVDTHVPIPHIDEIRSCDALPPQQKQTLQAHMSL
jgi:hypothetical protein